MGQPFHLPRNPPCALQVKALLDTTGVVVPTEPAGGGHAARSAPRAMETQTAKPNYLALLNAQKRKDGLA